MICFEDDVVDSLPSRDAPGGGAATEDPVARQELTRALENLSVDELSAIGGLLLPGETSPNPSPTPPPPPKKVNNYGAGANNGQQRNTRNSAFSFSSDDNHLQQQQQPQRRNTNEDPPPQYSPPRHAAQSSNGSNNRNSSHSLSSPLPHSLSASPTPPCGSPYPDNPPTYRAAVGESPMHHQEHSNDERGRLSRALSVGDRQVRIEELYSIN